MSMFGYKQEVIATSSGHYAVPLNDSSEILENTVMNKCSIVLHTDSLKGQDRKVYQII